MSKYRIVFIQEWEYEVEANDEVEAEDLAYDQFNKTMREPIAHTSYDNVRIHEYDENHEQWFELVND